MCRGGVLAYGFDRFYQTSFEPGLSKALMGNIYIMNEFIHDTPFKDWIASN